MPNANVRADARTLPEATSSRAILGAVLAVGAIGVAAIAARAATAAEPVSEDAELFALIDKAREVGARVEAALSAMVEVMERTGEMDNERYQQLWEERADASELVADARARTQSGIMAKIAFVEPDFDDKSASWLTGEAGVSPEILLSIVVDYKELKAAEKART